MHQLLQMNNFNTSYVVIKPFTVYVNKHNYHDFNTSYVVIKLAIRRFLDHYHLISIHLMLLLNTKG